MARAHCESTNRVSNHRSFSQIGHCNRATYLDGHVCSADDANRCEGPSSLVDVGRNRPGRALRHIHNDLRSRYQSANFSGLTRQMLDTYHTAVRSLAKSRQQGLLPGSVAGTKALEDDALDVVRLQESPHGRARDTREDAQGGCDQNTIREHVCNNFVVDRIDLTHRLCRSLPCGPGTRAPRAATPQPTQHLQPPNTTVSSSPTQASSTRPS